MPEYRYDQLFSLIQPNIRLVLILAINKNTSKKDENEELVF